MLDNLLQLYPKFETWYGPNLHSQEDRYYIYLYNSITGERTTISYAKALMECKLQRRLTDNEEVDHIDDNRRNDDINNLQVLSKLEHRQKNTHVVVICNQCKKEFKKLKCRVNQRKKFIGGDIHYCSNTCKIEFRRKK